MARKVVNRKELRKETEAAEAAGATKKKVKAKAAPRKRKTAKKKAAVEVRMKAFWGVFNQSLKRVAVFEYSQKKAAEKKAADLSASGNKTPHFVQLVKEAIVEE